MPIKLRRLTHNWKLKLLALGLSVFLWALVQNEPTPETFPAVPVRVDVTDTSWTTAGPPNPSTVELRLGGPAGEMVKLARGGPTVHVPISEVGSSDTVVTIHRDWVDLGSDTRLNVDAVSPPAVHISFERADTRIVRAYARFRGSLPRHLALAGPVALNPGMIRVRGPRSRVDGLDSVPLDPLDLSGVNGSGDFTVGVDTSALPGVRVIPSSASLTLRVEEEIERVLPAVPVDLQRQDGIRLIVEPASVGITLTGARTPVIGLDPSRLKVQVAPATLRGMAPGEERHVPLRIEGVPSLVSAAPDPEMVTVRRPAATAGGGGSAEPRRPR